MPTTADVPLDHIAAPLRALAVPIDSLTLDPANARTHDEKNLAAIRGSLKRFGQRLPLVVQRQGMIVRAGNGRVMAARQLGWAHVACVVVDESEVEATAFAIADNRSAEMAEWDDEALAKLLQSLPDGAPPHEDGEPGGFTLIVRRREPRVYECPPPRVLGEADGDGRQNARVVPP